jgi:S-adenosylmethionine decarboxylase proenzyme
MSKKIVFSFLFIVSSFFCFSQEELPYDFVGSHFLASYYGCDPTLLNDKQAIISFFEEGIAKSGATLLKIADYQFSPQGVTIVALLSESHASIHTYPELGACFVDFFTCGTSCDHTKFHEVLEKGLQAHDCKTSFIERN